MNNKSDILDAMILVEQLSEGEIDLKKDNFLSLLKEGENITIPDKKFFLDYIEKKSVKKKYINQGIALYFGIFDFNKTIELLRKKNNIDTTDEDITKKNKFTLVLYFDKQLELQDSIFYTTSGYIMEHNGEFPKDISKEEQKLFSEIKASFKDDFDGALSALLKKYDNGENEFRYEFVGNLNSCGANLHSFFIKDLRKARETDTENLMRFLGEDSVDRVNLDGKSDSKNFNAAVFENILQPIKYPFGRFPSNVEYAPYFMQQTAINIALGDNNENLRSVNGPPGTGKTTLLKDVFSELVVKQAYEMCKMSVKKIAGSILYYKENGKIGALPHCISDLNIVVASSNNGAVQNIVNELPLVEQMDSGLIDMLREADYFYDIANSEPEKDKKDQEPDENYDELCETSDDNGEKSEKWGLFSLEGGAKQNIKRIISCMKKIEEHLNSEYTPLPTVYDEFTALYKSVEKVKKEVQTYYEKSKSLNKLKLDLNSLNNEMELNNSKYIDIENQLSENSTQLTLLYDSEKQAQRNYDVVVQQKPMFLWLLKIFGKANRYLDELKACNDELNNITSERKKYEKNKIDIEKHKNKIIKSQSEIKSKVRKISEEIAEIEALRSKYNIKPLDLSVSYEDLQKSSPWFSKEFRILQSKLFILAMKVRKQFLFENVKNLKGARIVWEIQDTEQVNSEKLLPIAWNWVNFAVPVIGTTFASFGTMLKNLGKGTVSNLFIDEAGQALPQACVGALLRCKRIMAVGDPAQIKPVLTMDSKILSFIGKDHNVDQRFLSHDVSVQTIFDRVGKYSFAKSDDEWIGIPLWVHRRSNYPMFSISNTLSYNNLMVQGKKSKEAFGKAQWYDCKGNANDKYVKEQGELLIKLIEEKRNDGNDDKDIFVITPFWNVKSKLETELKSIGFVKYDKDNKTTNVGTVHTFQGKEAKIVYLVLGAGENSKGAAAWAVSEANIMNVAATRAKEEFYIIGDRNLYKSLGSVVVDKTISILNQYNNNAENRF